MSWLSKLLHLRNRAGFDESLAEEIHLHIEERAAELRAAGAPPRLALERARREFGSSARAAEESRDAWRWSWLEDLRRDCRHAARGLARDRGFTATAILSLALGIGINTAMFSLTAEFLLSQPSVRDGNTLVNVNIGGGMQAPLREYRFLRDASVFDGLAGANPMQEVNWRTGDTSVRIFVTRVTDNYFEVTGVPLSLGRPIQNRETGVAVISHSFWQSRLSGDPQVLSRYLVLDGRPHAIVGVLTPVHRTLSGFGFAPEMYLPITGDSARVSLHGRLRQGEPPEAALGRLRSACEQLDRTYPDSNHKWASGVRISGLVGVERLRQGFMPSVTAFFGLLMAASGLLLIIACANVASLLLARASTRAQEFAVRMSIGAGRGRLIRQMLTESLMLAVLGTSAGLLLNIALTRFLNRAVFSVPFPMRLSIQPDIRLLVYAIVVAILSAVLAGLIPALKSTREGANALLKRDEHQVSGRRATLRNVLVAGQLAVSVLVLILATLSIRNLIQSASLDPGFDIGRTIWAQVRLVPESYPGPAKIRAMAASTLERLDTGRGIVSASIATFVPLNDHFASRTLTLFTDAMPQGARIEHSWNAVGPDYFETMGIELIDGREFTMLDREGAQRVVVVNQSLARRIFGPASPLGRRIRFGRDDRIDRVVVGVARNSKYSTIGERDRAALYEPFFQASGSRTTLNFLVRTSGAPEASLNPLTRELLNIDPASSVEIKPMNRAMAFALLPSRLGAALLGSIGALGLALASVGLYGVLAYSIGRRTREIGLRLALGAPRGRIVRLVLTEGAWILAAGLTVGGLLAFLVTQPLARFLVPGLKPSDPLSFLSVALILMAVSCAASLLPALRALRIDPMVALRYE